MTDLYQEILLEEAKHPQFQGSLPNADVVQHRHNASCGDQITVFIKFSPGAERLETVLWQGQGCVISQAAMSVVAQAVQGKTRAEVALLNQSWLLTQLGLTEISPGRLKCLLLGLSAVQAALV